MNDAGPPDPPASGRPSDVSDEELSAALRKWTVTAPALHPVGVLLDRHWAAAFAYARLCTDGPRAAGMLTTAAFTRLFGESLGQAGPSAAWRPHLLVTVRHIAAEWDGDGRRELLHPALRSNAGTGERAVARLLPPPGRRLLTRAFQRLPQSARVLLWHAEAEAEPLAVPAALLGLDEEDARGELRRARERLREECLQAHRELAPQDECRRYLRMLDVTFRRGGTDVDPDLRQHLAGCRHCRRTADQLDHFTTGLGLPLAEAVLGWGARAYRESRAARDGGTTGPRPRATPPAPPGGEDFGAPAAPPPAAAAARPPRRRARAAAPAAPPGAPGPSRRSAHRAARRARRRTLALAAGAVGGLVILPLALWSVLGSGGGDRAGAPGSPPEASGEKPPAPGASWAGGNGGARGALAGRLRNLASGLCVDVAGGQAVRGAEAELAPCSGTEDQQWRYESDGLLRSASDPGLCLDSRLGYSVRLTSCTATGRAARGVRYDFTLQGVFVPRRDQDLALTPAATDGSGTLVLKNRTGTAVQRWTVDPARTDPQVRTAGWDADSTPSPAAPAGTAPRPARAPQPSARPAAPDGCAVRPSPCAAGGRHDGGRGPGGSRDRRR
ncbi:RICIN domain-containing protein [Streptomyces sp. TG1A-8]|uniref:RICIN domain-containing protein n=1 Tax=Streptomyces sp. TG1A-8 TaxID=3051385 RepID=UPI00265B84EC|nr:RICIN domain-containing protein [Streptomyces sp. TG1A-8]MDO0924541.1 RICIN domain-containing protein [Streptomyces sp. TG1A-8]